MLGKRPLCPLVGLGIIEVIQQPRRRLVNASTAGEQRSKSFSCHRLNGSLTLLSTMQMHDHRYNDDFKHSLTIVAESRGLTLT